MIQNSIRKFYDWVKWKLNGSPMIYAQEFEASSGKSKLIYGRVYHLSLVLIPEKIISH